MLLSFTIGHAFNSQGGEVRKRPEPARREIRDETEVNHVLLVRISNHHVMLD